MKWFFRAWLSHWRSLFEECRGLPWYHDARPLGVVIMLTIMPVMLAIVAWRERDLPDWAKPP